MAKIKLTLIIHAKGKAYYTDDYEVIYDFGEDGARDEAMLQLADRLRHRVVIDRNARHKKDR